MVKRLRRNKTDQKILLTINEGLKAAYQILERSGKQCTRQLKICWVIRKKTWISA